MTPELPYGYRLERGGDDVRWWRVYGPDQGRAIAAGQTPEDAIDGAMRAIKKARRRQRPCICCGVSIMSEGPHHRMCRNCRIGAYEQVAV